MKDSDRQRLALVEKRLDKFYETITSFEDELFCEEFKSKVATLIDSIEFFCTLRNVERAENEVTKLEACIDKFVKDKSSSEEEGKAEEAPFSGAPKKWKESDIPPYPQSNDPDVWCGYVDYLYQLLFAYMLGSVDVFSAKEWDWACKNHIYEPNHTLAHKAQYVHNEEARDCYIVGERKFMEERLKVPEFARTITHSIYIAHQALARLNAEEDLHFGREEGESI